jgi:hypothetical protein
MESQELRGTHFLVADGHGRGHMFTEGQRHQFESLLPEEMHRDEETVLFLRVTATNTSPALRYAFFRSLVPTVLVMAPVLGIIETLQPPDWSFDGTKGFSVYPSGGFCPKAERRFTPERGSGDSAKAWRSATLEVYLPIVRLVLTPRNWPRVTLSIDRRNAGRFGAGS